MICPGRKLFFKQESGQAIVEFCIVFPVLFLIILTVIQTAQLYIAKQMVNYAAFCSARSAIVWINENASSYTKTLDKAKKAAWIACIPISPKFQGGDFQLPSPLDDMADYGSRYLWAKLFTKVKLIGPDGKELSDSGSSSVSVHDDITVEVTHDYSMRIPLINKIFYYLCSQSIIAKSQRLIHGGPEKNLRLQPFSEYQNLEVLGYSLYQLPISARCTLTVEGKDDKSS